MDPRLRRARRRRRRRLLRVIPAMIFTSSLMAAALVCIFLYLIYPNLNIQGEIRQSIEASSDGGEKQSTDKPSVTDGTTAAPTKRAKVSTVTGMELSSSSLSIEKGKKRKILVTLYPEKERHDDDVIYEVSDPDIISVNKHGNITALKAGDAYVSVTAGEYKKYCLVHVLSHVTKLDIGTGLLEMKRGEETELPLQIFPEDTTDDRTAVWTSSDTSIVTVDEKGKVTAVGPGTAGITVTVAGRSATREIKVNVPVERIFVMRDSYKISKGETLELPVSYGPAEATEIPEYTFRSINEAAVTVDRYGTIKGVGPGTSRIIVEYGELSAYVDITVVIPVTGVAMYPNEITVAKGDTATLQAAVTPLDTTDERYIDWSSDNANVATVSGGLVSALGAGTAVIYASHDDLYATCLVHVISPLKGIYLNQYSLSLIEGSTGGFSVGYDPEDTTDDRTVTWTSDNPSVATVSDGIVTAVSAGTCRIHAQVGDEMVSAEVTVTPYISVESVVLSPTSLVFENFGDTSVLTATVLPQNATQATVSFMTSDPNVAIVSSDGTVKAVGAGDCTVTATCGAASATCSVHVNAENIVVVLDPGHCDLRPGAYNETYNIREEIINLKVAKACRDYLLANYSGVTVYMTRENGNPLDSSSNAADLQARAQFAQDKGAAIMVSMHFNATANHNASGCVVFVSSNDNVKAACNSLGTAILAEIAARTGLRNRGCESYLSADNQDYYAINRYCANRGIPGIIVEHCFMDYDVQFIQDDESLTTFGIADAVGIAKYLGLQKK